VSEDKVKKALETMASRKMNCAQTVFTSFCEEFGIERRLALQIAQGFGGGMHIDGVCGAVTGAYMALGLAHKISPKNPRASVEKTNALLKEFSKKFKTLHGSLTCTGLIGYNLSNQEESAKARKKDVFNTKCPVYVRDAVKIVESLLKG
jgi:C_GCAxxG_C_C family probable redox protein